MQEQMSHSQYYAIDTRVSSCLLIAIFIFTSFAVAGDTGPAKSSGPAHATVENRVAEADLTTITLTPAATTRLAIKTVAVREGSIARRRLLGGETMVPLGRTIQLAAPFGGTISAIEGQSPPMPGASLKKGDAIVRLQPIVMADREVLSPSERIALARAAADFEAAQAQAQGDVSAAQVQLETTRVRLERAERLRKENATSEKLLDEAKAEFELAKAHLEAAQAKVSAWKDAAKGMRADPQLGLDLVAPFDCVLADLTATPGEIIAPGKLIARLISIDPLWVRIPVFVGAMKELDPQSDVRIADLDGGFKSDGEVIERITGTPTADPLSSTIDLFFRLPNSTSRYRPMQRVGVSVRLAGTKVGLIVPSAAVLYDYHGGSWVYEQVAPHKYTRRRVVIQAIEGNDAYLAQGPRAGAEVVTDGAAELFGVEFGAGK